MKNINFNAGAIIYQEIEDATSKKCTQALPFPSTITKLCELAKVYLDPTE